MIVGVSSSGGKGSGAPGRGEITVLASSGGTGGPGGRAVSPAGGRLSAGGGAGGGPSPPGRGEITVLASSGGTGGGGPVRGSPPGRAGSPPAGGGAAGRGGPAAHGAVSGDPAGSGRAGTEPTGPGATIVAGSLVAGRGGAQAPPTRAAGAATLVGCWKLKTHCPTTMMSRWCRRCGTPGSSSTSFTITGFVLPGSMITIPSFS